MRNTLGATIDSASEFAKRDLQRVKDFYEYEPDALKYMLVQIKAKRAAWEKHIGLLTGTLEKIGFIPTIIALLAILIRPEIGQFSKVWVQNIAIGVFSLYFGSFVVNHLMTKLDRAIMLIEMVIESKKSEHRLIEPWYAVSSKNGKKRPYTLCSACVHTRKPAIEKPWSGTSRL